MPKRWIIVSGAVLLGGCILGLSLMFSSATAPKAKQPKEGQRPKLRPSDLPPGLGPQALKEEGPGKGAVLNPESEAGKGKATRVEANRTTVITWRTIQPQRRGIYQVSSPTVTLKFHDGPKRRSTRALTVTADEATIVAPGGNFRRGEFRKNVLFTLYRSASDSQPVSLKNPAHARMAVELNDNAAFDLELGKLTSNGPVHLASRRVDFQGTGLSLKYNQLRRRIERLVVDQGKELRFDRPEGGQAADRDAARSNAGHRSTSSPAQSPAENRSSSSANAKTTQNSTSNESEGEPAPAQPNPPKGPQFYQARFADQVRIQAKRGLPTADAQAKAHAGATQVEMTGQALEVVFAMEPRDSLADDSAPGEALPSATGRDASSRQSSSQPTQSQGQNQSSDDASTQRQSKTKTDTQSETQIEPEKAKDSPAAKLLARSKPDDVVVDWAGRLVLTPVREAKPPSEHFAASAARSGKREAQTLSPPEHADDVRLTLRGSPQRPARADTQQNQTITGSELSYHTVDQSLHAKGNANQPLMLNSPSTGQLRGKRLVLNRSAGEGYVLGPGKLTAAPHAPHAPHSPHSPRSPQPLEITTGSKQGDRRPPANVKNEPDHEQEDPGEQSQPLSVTWTDRFDFAFFRNPEGEKPRSAKQGGGDLAALRHARFQGNVQAQQGEKQLDADRIDLAFHRVGADPRRSAPSELIAHQNVHARQPGMEFTAGHLKARLGTKAPGEQAQASPALGQDQPAGQKDLGLASAAGGLGGGSQTKIRRVTASDQVEVHFEQRDATVHAARLAAAPDSQMLEMYGQADDLAVLERPDGRLSGDRIILNQKTGKVRVIGAGDFTHQPQPSDENHPQDGPAKLLVRWTRGMEFANQQRTAHFFGEVVAQTQNRTEHSELRSQDLRLLFNEAQAKADAHSDNANAENAENAENAQATETAKGQTLAKPGTEPTNSLGSLQKLTAREQVVFTASKRKPTAAARLDSDGGLMDQPDNEAAQAKPLNRIRIQGPLLTLETREQNASGPPATPGAQAENEKLGDKVVQVIGPGRMLIEDYRAKAHRGEEDLKPPNPAKGQAGFTGRGATLFTWNGQLDLNGPASRMVIQDDVQMVHRPKTQTGKTLQLDSERLLVQLSKDTKGPRPGVDADEAPAKDDNAPRATNANKPGENPLVMPADTKIETIRAEQAVRVTQGKRVIDCDLLRYRRQTHQLVLLGQDRKIQAYEDGKPSSLAARKLIWDLQTNRIEARQATGGAAVGE